MTNMKDESSFGSLSALVRYYKIFSFMDPHTGKVEAFSLKDENDYEDVSKWLLIEWNKLANSFIFVDKSLTHFKTMSLIHYSNSREKIPSKRKH